VNSNVDNLPVSNNFIKAMQFVSLHEWSNREDGAYTNDPVDPGGETKFGISKKAHPTLDIKNLTLAEALVIYYNEYWVVNRCDNYGIALATCIFDTAVNGGIKLVKRMTSNDYKELISLRRQRYLGLIQRNPALSKFKNGWMNRLNDLAKFCEIQEQAD